MRAPQVGGSSEEASTLFDTALMLARKEGDRTAEAQKEYEEAIKRIRESVATGGPEF